MKQNTKRIVHLLVAALLFAGCIFGSMHVAHGAEMLAPRTTTGFCAAQQTTDTAHSIRPGNTAFAARNRSYMPIPASSPAAAEVYASVENREGKLPASFEVYGYLEESGKTLYVSQSLTCRNNTGASLEHICFRLPQIAQQDDRNIVMEKAQVGGAGVHIQQVDTSVCSMDLPATLPEGGSVNMRIVYRISATNLPDLFANDAAKTSLLRDLLTVPVAYEEGAPYSRVYLLPAPFAPKAQTIRSAQWSQKSAN